MIRLKTFLLTFMLSIGISAGAAIPMRGVVYDVGLKFGGTTLSVENYDSARVDYDMNIIKNILCCNTVRIEGESISRLVSASRIANKYGLKILFNPWKMEVDRNQTVDYMSDAAASAEKLRKEGLDLVFVAGCEYSLFCKGVFKGDTFDDRMKWMFSLGTDKSTAMKEFNAANERLNDILKDISRAIRKSIMAR